MRYLSGLPLSFFLALFVASCSGADPSLTSPPSSEPTYQYVTYGLYPQTVISDASLISALNLLETPEENDWYRYGGEYFFKTRSYLSLVPRDADFTFSDGTICTDGETYWFRVEPIEWRVLSSKDGDLFLTSKYLLDGFGWYFSSYADSGYRKWLNETFVEKAFCYDDALIRTTAVDNSAASTGDPDNPYACETTNDKIFLLSFADVINPEYGFDTNESRVCKVTDYALSQGVYKLKEWGSGYWWTRSPYGPNPMYTRDVTYDGKLSYDRGNNSYNGARPALHVDNT